MLLTALVARTSAAAAARRSLQSPAQLLSALSASTASSSSSQRGFSSSPLQFDTHRVVKRLQEQGAALSHDEPARA